GRYATAARMSASTSCHGSVSHKTAGSERKDKVSSQVEARPGQAVVTWPGGWNESCSLIGLGLPRRVSLVHVRGLIPGAAASDAAPVLAGLGRREAHAHLVERDRSAGRDCGAWVGSWPGDCDGDDFTDGLEAGFGVVGDGGLDVPLAL